MYWGRESKRDIHVKKVKERHTCRKGKRDIHAEKVYRESKTYIQRKNERQKKVRETYM